jgi:hypothetical protein
MVLVVRARNQDSNGLGFMWNVSDVVGGPLCIV